MNARQLKAAFYFREEVYSSDKKHPIEAGFVSEIIWTLSGSGKKKTAGLITSRNRECKTEPIPCRHIHFKKEKPEHPYRQKTPNDHSLRIIDAFMNVMTVVAAVPGYTPVIGVIKEIVYWKDPKGIVRCSAVLDDRAASGKSTYRARIKYVFLEDAYKEKGC